MEVALALETFQEELAGQMASFFIDNAGALAGFIKGASKSAEQNIIIGESWMIFARRQIATVLESGEQGKLCRRPFETISV